MSTKDIFVPAYSNILVRLTKPQERTHGGLVLPETFIEKMLPETGTVVAIGWEVPHWFAPGSKLVFGRFAATTFADGYAVVAAMNVEGYVVEEDALRLPPEISEEWVGAVHPPPGQIYVERNEMPTEVGPILMPDGINLHVKSSEATVRAVAEDIADKCPWKVGDGVFLHPSVQRGFAFSRVKGTTFNRCPPQQIMAYVGEFGSLPKHARPEGEGFRETLNLTRSETEPDRFLEGDRRGF